MLDHSFMYSPLDFLLVPRSLNLTATVLEERPGWIKQLKGRTQEMDDPLVRGRWEYWLVVVVLVVVLVVATAF